MELLRLGRNPFKDMAEVFRFQGVLMLATRFEFGKRGELWITLGKKCMTAVESGNTCMGRDRFKGIFSAHIY